MRDSSTSSARKKVLEQKYEWVKVSEDLKSKESVREEGGSLGCGSLLVLGLEAWES